MDDEDEANLAAIENELEMMDFEGFLSSEGELTSPELTYSAYLRMYTVNILQALQKTKKTACAWIYWRSKR